MNRDFVNIQCIVYRISREVEKVEEMDILVRSEIRAYERFLETLPDNTTVQMFTESRPDEVREVAIVGNVIDDAAGRITGHIILNQKIAKYPELNNYTVCRSVYELIEL